MQQLFIIGNLTADPQTKDVGERQVCNFTVAVNRKRKPDGTQEADFFRIAAWGKMGENCQKYLAKGRKVCVTGTVSAHAYQKQDGTAAASLEVFAQSVEFLSPAGAQGQTESAGQMTDVSGMVDDELPF